MARKMEWNGWYESRWGETEITAYGNRRSEVQKYIRKHYPDAIGADGEIENEEGDWMPMPMS